MKKISVLLALFLASASLQLVIAQNSEQKAAVDIIKAYKNKDAALLKNYVTGFIAMAITDDFFDRDDGKPAVEMAKEWDGKIREAEAKVADMREDMKSHTANEIENLKRKLDNAREKLQDEKKQPENFWEDLQQGIENNWKELEMAMKSVFSPMK